MSKETAAAILTKVYYDHVRNADHRLDDHAPQAAPGAVEKIGVVYGAFYKKLDDFPKMHEG